MSMIVGTTPYRGRARAALRGAALLMTLLLAVAAVPATGSPATADLAVLGGEGSGDLVQEARAVVADVRSALSEGSYLSAVTGIQGAAGGAMAIPDLPAATPADLAAVAGLRPALRAPVAGLYAAVQRTADLLGGPRTDAQMRRFHARLAPHRGGDADRRITYRPGRGDEIVLPQPAQPVELAVGDVPAGSLAADPLVAAALDRYLPALRAAAEPAGARSGRQVAGCDELDQLPYLCIGSEADNTYTEDAMLLIDTGGDDVYKNSSAGAPFKHPDQDVWLNVSVLADLGGTDRYGVTSYDMETSLGTKLLIVRGSGASFGAQALGLLADEGAGDDSYLATVPNGGKTGVDHVYVTAQGAASSDNLIGDPSGYLFDAGGNDSYVTAGPSWSATPNGVTVVAQGSTVAHLGQSAGVMVDRGDGDDVYHVDSLSPEPDTAQADPSPEQRTWAQGTADGSLVGTVTNPVRRSAGVLYDEGGDDRLRTRMFASRRTGRGRVEPIEFRTPRVHAQAAGDNALALLLTGEGSTRYDVRVEGVGALEPEVYAQGASFGWSLNQEVENAGVNGILDDKGGNDDYGVDIALDARHQRTITHESCPAPCTSADTNVSMAYCSPRQDGHGNATCWRFASAAQGAALGGAALLEDHAGDDRYRFWDHRTFDVAVEDLRSSSPAASVDVEGFLMPVDLAQGAGIGGRSEIALVDHDGTDRYDLSIGTETFASGTSSDPTATPRVVAEARGNLMSAGQGAVPGGLPSSGGLLDLGGADDVFQARLRAVVETLPDPDGAFAWPEDRPAFHGSGDAGMVFAALGDNPSIVSSPSAPTCGVDDSSARGFGTWFNCLPYLSTSELASHPDPRQGWGTAPEAVGGQTQVTFIDPPTAAQGGMGIHERLPVVARLTDAQGAPIPGQPLRFTFQAVLPGTPIGNINDATVAEAVTGADGIARARLPVRYTAGFPDPSLQHRIEVAFDGVGARHHPSSTFVPITVE
jgi:hypothetical protein